MALIKRCTTDLKTYKSCTAYGMNKSPDNKGFKDVFDNISSTAKLVETKFNATQENSKKHVSKIISYSEITAVSGKTEQELLEKAKAQEQFKLDIKRIAMLMGLPPAFVEATIGELKIDPKNLNFKIATDADLAVNDIAQYFGISPMTLLAILDKLKINPGDLEYKEEKGRIISKLKEFFHLNLDQEKELAKIIEKYATKDKPK